MNPGLAAETELETRWQQAEQLRSRALTDRRVLDKLQCVPYSASADQTVLVLRERYLETLEQRSDLLDALLHDTEAQRATLQKRIEKYRDDLIRFVTGFHIPVRAR